MCKNENCSCCSHSEQRHVHEYLGSVRISESECDPHNHRFDGLTCEAIPMPCGSHFHKLGEDTDFYQDHFHMIEKETGPAICVGNGRHIHFVEGWSSCSDGHRHDYQLATLIDNPIGN